MARSVNTEFQDDGLNDNDVPYVSVVLNIAVEDFNDQQLISNGISNGSGANSSYQEFGIDVSPDRVSRELFGFNFFRTSQAVTTSIPGDRRRVVVLDGSTGEVLLNESAASSGTTQAARVIAAVNSITLAPEESFGRWIGEAGVPEALMGANDDPDGDGLTNLLEYALGLDPSLADADEGLRIESGPLGRSLVFQRSKSALVEPIIIEIGASPDNFALHSPAPEAVSVADQGETELVSVVLPELGGKVFARLRTSAQ